MGAQRRARKTVLTALHRLPVLDLSWGFVLSLTMDPLECHDHYIFIELSPQLVFSSFASQRVGMTTRIILSFSGTYA